MSSEEWRKRKGWSLSPSRTVLPFSSSHPSPASLSISRKMGPTQTLFPSPSRTKDLLLAISLLATLYLLYRDPAPLASPSRALHHRPSATARRHLLFSVASSSASFPRREPYIRLWYAPNSTRAFAFLDRPPAPGQSSSPALPPVVISKDASSFPYTCKGGLRSAVRVARVVKEAVELNQTGVRWFVFGDDDTVFFVDNLVRTLAKYDHEGWHYVGSNSESFDQNQKYSFEMGFGGAGFAISYPLAKVLAGVFDSCLFRYSHLYGSDARVFSCLAELGVRLTHEPGFHQVDMRGNLFGMLSSHPLSPLLSLHHLEAADPIYPNMSKTGALERLFGAADVDPGRILQQTVCYHRANSLTVSVAWGYSVQVFEGNELLPDLLSMQKSFRPWRRSADFSHYMFNTRDYPRDACKRPLVFFMDSVTSDKYGTWSNYTRGDVADCRRNDAVRSLKHIRVLSQKLEPDAQQMKAPRRQCCDISSSNRNSMVISIRQCGPDELISMHH